MQLHINYSLNSSPNSILFYTIYSIVTQDYICIAIQQFLLDTRAHTSTHIYIKHIYKAILCRLVFAIYVILLYINSRKYPPHRSIHFSTEHQTLFMVQLLK